MVEQWRETSAVVVAADSPAGQAAREIDTVAAHLPPPGLTWTCQLCSASAWPCRAFDEAARALITTGFPLAVLVPLELHSELWPTTPQSRFEEDDPDG